MARHRASKSRLLEAHRESRGNRGSKPMFKASTPETRAERVHFCVLKQKQEELLDQLPPQYVVYPDKPHRDPPRFHFGVGVTYRQLYDYSVQHRLVPDKFFTDSRRSFDTIEATCKHLDRMSGIKLYLQPVRHPKYGWIVARYSNYTWYYEEVEARQEQIVIDLIRRELNIQDMPQWHHSTSP
ncbi:hypothetical protein EWM64_g1774 [Hericium alpestre]|uniref:Uncharacterized protein n=1 Tax=Hericium alpestre TaxID=135208 RepID=A0A4Z0A8G9_9AGAM|nr:hypothetical protein EWM64_g1774 [Hericium alpestre]